MPKGVKHPDKTFVDDHRNGLLTNLRGNTHFGAQIKLEGNQIAVCVPLSQQRSVEQLGNINGKLFIPFSILLFEQRGC